MSKRRLLVVNFFPAFFPPSSGGEQRFYYLYRHLSECYDISLLSPTYSDRKEECVVHTSSFREYRVPKPDITNQLHAQLASSGIGGECSAFVVSLAAGLDDAFARTLRGLAKKAEIIIHESPYTLPYDKDFGCDGIPRIYNSYNVEYRLAAQILKGDVGRRATNFIRFLEQRLVSGAKAVFATSEEEREAFCLNFGAPRSKVFLAPNGHEPSSSTIPSAHVVSRDTASVVFLGSSHPPNVEALDFIATRLAPACPDLKFRIIGNVGKAYPRGVPRNVELLGILPEDEKSRLLRECGAAINPLRSGAGTNLKMLDYMSHGAPIVTTAIGARGLPLEDCKHARIVDHERFASALMEVLDSGILRATLSKASTELAQTRYTWAAIATEVAGVIDRVLEVRDDHLRPRRKLVSVCDYDIHRAFGGGQVRVSALLRELGREYDVTFLCLTNDADESRQMLWPGVWRRAIPKTAAHLAEERDTSQGQLVSIGDILASVHCVRNSAFVAAFREETSDVSAVLFEQCYLAPLLDYVPSDLPVIYSSQNCETELKKLLLALRTDEGRWLDTVQALEEKMLKCANLTVCVSTEDTTKFRARQPSASIILVENGVDVDRRLTNGGSAKATAETDVPLALFLGSAHPPNVQAAKYIVEVIAPAAPEIQFLLVGTVCDAFAPGEVPRNVSLLGFVTHAEKKALLQGATLAVNPMFDGGGSSLKVADYFAAGLPVVSSMVGARGYEITPHEHYVCATPETFIEEVRRLSSDAELRRRIHNNALSFAHEKLDWRMLGGTYRKALRRLLPQDDKLRVLALTYRFGDPPPGGAEAYLTNVLRELGAMEDVMVDVAACNIGKISNHWHFSATYAPPDTVVATKPVYLRNRFLFAVDEPDASTFSKCAQLFRLWAFESRATGHRIAPKLTEPLLLGGWNNPEVRSDSKVFRWTSGCAQIWIPQGSGKLKVGGFAPTACRVDFRSAEKIIHTADVSDQFQVEVPLADVSGILELTCSKLHHAPQDPRELGCMITEIIIDTGAQCTALNLAEDHESFLRRTNPQMWIDELIAATEARDKNDDDLFLQARGPHSTALAEWLEDHAANYDVILAQGVPFSTSALGVDIARREGVPIAVLPHFHMEDRYYHWQGFYRAFQQADVVIGAPSSVKRMFFDRIGAHCTILPGGGLDISEFTEEAIGAGRTAFQRIHSHHRPFVLVLGRKSGAKNYRTAIAAVTQLHSTDHQVDLVMIGPDEDELPIREPGVYYYGAQPRDVVIGALADALCLVNMSESESFGIVLLEAWLAGTPVIAQRKCLAFAELIEDAENGFLANDCKEASCAISQYLAQPELAAAHAKQGARLAQRYSWHLIAKDLKSVFSAIRTQQG